MEMVSNTRSLLPARVMLRVRVCVLLLVLVVRQRGVVGEAESGARREGAQSGRERRGAEQREGAAAQRQDTDSIETA
eukprot:2455365-Rhodomonas_salina.1